MIYTIEKANMITEQLKRFTTGYAHHVVGQFANIDFWLHEVNEAKNTIDAYGTRFKTMKKAQEVWIDNHDTEVYDYCPYCNGKCELSNGTPAPPKRTSSSDLDSAKRELTDAAYYFLMRCYRMGLLTKETLQQKCDFINTSIDPDDLKAT